MDKSKHTKKKEKGLRGVGYGINALRSYHKEYDEKNRTFKNRPRHDWSSHAADAFRYFAVTARPKMTIVEAMKQARKEGKFPQKKARKRNLYSGYR